MYIIWDNDGTIQSSRTPMDTTRTLLPHVERIMTLPGVVNIICSGCKTAESERQDFDPVTIIANFESLMETLPLQGAAFFPKRGGTECHVLFREKIKPGLKVFKAHEDPKYQPLVGHFKKPEAGMLMVLKDLIQENLFPAASQPDIFLMIGDTWHDKSAARKAGMAFLEASRVHQEGATMTLDFLRRYAAAG